MMSAGRHYDDETLLVLLESSDAETISRDPHLAACSACLEVADSLRLIADSLGEADVWDPRELDETARPDTIATLRAFADEMSREDAQAAIWLKDLLDGPRESWMSKLSGHPEYRTAGMVRQLIAATDRALDTMPPDAVAMTALATDVADGIPPASYVTDTVAKLRGAAWRLHAYALFYVGSYAEAEAAIRASESHFSGCVVNEYDLGRDDIVHALIHRALDRDAEAIAVAGRAVSRLGDTGDVQRYVSAVMVQAQAQMKSLDHAGALTVLKHTCEKFADRISAQEHALLLGNMGICQRAVRDFDAAIESYRTAAMLFEDLDIPTDATRIRANIAVVLREAGRISEAAKETYEVRAAFKRLGMASDVAISGLVLAEIALERSDYSEVESLCRESMQYYEAAGLPFGPRAMTALAYVTEAARQRRLTPEAVRHVERYLRRLPSQPTLLFARPSE